MSLLLSWDGSGAILVERMPVFRVVFIEADFFTVFLDSLEKALGLSVRHVAFEAQRKSICQAIAHVLESPLRVLTYGKTMKKLMARVFCRVAYVTGTSYARALEYRPGRLGRAVIRNPFDREMMASIILSAFEALEGVPFEHAWEERDGELVISVRPARSRSDIAERMDYTPLQLKVSERRVPACPRCGVPAAITHLKWDSKEGNITDDRDGTRFVVLDAYTPEVVIRELVNELGEDFYPLIVEAYREFSLPHIRFEYRQARKDGNGRKELYALALDAMAARGQGNPVFWSADSGRLDVVVENPFEVNLLAGYFAALYEVAEGKRAQVDWDCPDPLTAVYSVGPC